MKQLFALILFTSLFTNALAQAGGEDCATATVISSIPFVGTGSTSAAVDDYQETCPDVGNQGGAKDVVYKYTTGASVEYITLSLCIAGTNYDSQLYVYEGSCSSGTSYACQEDGCQSPAYNNAYNSEIIDLMLQANTDYYIVIDGYSSSQNGNYQLNVDPGVAPPTTQITFGDSTSLLPTTTIAARSGSPMAIGDMNGDGLDDIVRLHNSQTLLIAYQQPNGTFTELSLGNVAPFDKVWGITIADADTNGYNDIAIGDYNDVRIYWADSVGGSYNSQSVSSSLIFAQGMNFVDIDQDGLAELFVCNDIDESHLYQYDGSSWSRDTTWLDMTTTPSTDMSGNYASMFTDLDSDGDLDLYITKCRQGVTSPSDGRRINQWIENTGSGLWAENTNTILRDSAQSWVTDFADIDNDGDFDAFVMNHDQVSRFYRNIGGGQFEEITTQVGLTQTGFAGIQTYFRDFNNDGFVDLLATGSEHRLWINNGDTTFTLDIDPFGVVNDWMLSSVVGDLNHDGFLDLYSSYGTIYNSASSSAVDRLWINQAASGFNFIELDLEGVVSNVNAIGARIEVYGPWGIQIREVRAGEGYGTQNSFMQHFGLGTATQIDSMLVKWPSGTVDHLYNIAANQFMTIIEGDYPLPPVSFSGGISSNVASTTATIDVQMTLREDLPTDVLFVYWPEGGMDSTGYGGNYTLGGSGPQVFNPTLNLFNLLEDTTYYWTPIAGFDPNGQNLTFFYDTLTFQTLPAQIDSNTVLFSNEQSLSITDSSATLQVDMELRQDYDTDVTFTYWIDGGAPQALNGGTFNLGGSGTQVFQPQVDLVGLTDDTTYHWTVEAVLDPSGNNWLFTNDTLSFMTPVKVFDSIPVEFSNLTANGGIYEVFAEVDMKLREDSLTDVNWFLSHIDSAQWRSVYAGVYHLNGGGTQTFNAMNTLWAYPLSLYDVYAEATFNVSGSNTKFYSDTVQVQTNVNSLNELGEHAVTVFPQPTNGPISVELSPAVRSVQPTYVVYNVEGKRIIEGPSVSSDFEFDLSEYPSGVYFLTLTGNNGATGTYRIIKQ